MNGQKSLILDANILIRSVLGTRVPALFEKLLPSVYLFTPQICIDDAYKYLPSILKKRGIEAHPFLQSLDVMQRHVSSIIQEVYGIHEESAQKRMRKRDVDDWHIVACSLLMDCPIWTEDADFFGSGVAIWTTDRIELYLEQ